jgi:hypothetical protein
MAADWKVRNAIRCEISPVAFSSGGGSSLAALSVVRTKPSGPMASSM